MGPTRRKHVYATRSSLDTLHLQLRSLSASSPERPALLESITSLLLDLAGFTIEPGWLRQDEWYDFEEIGRMVGIGIYDRQPVAFSCLEDVLELVERMLSYGSRDKMEREEVRRRFLRRMAEMVRPLMLDDML